MFEGITPLSQCATALRIPTTGSDALQIWRIEDRDMCPDYNPGDLVEVSFNRSDLATLRAGDTVVIKTPGGSQILRYFTPLVEGHFEAKAATGTGYGELTTFKMDLQIIGVVIKHLRYCRSRSLND